VVTLTSNESAAGKPLSPQAEAAALLGVSDRTVKRRWQSARLHLVDALHGQLPPEE